MKKFLCFIILGAGMAGCSTEPIDSAQELNSVNAKVKVQEYVGIDNPDFSVLTTDVVNLNNNMVVGQVTVTNDCDYLFIKMESAKGGLDEVAVGAYTSTVDFPKQNGTQGDLMWDETDATTDTPSDPVDYLWSIPLETFGTDTSISIFVNTKGGWAGPEAWGDKASYYNYELDLESCTEVCTYGKGWWRNHSNKNPGNQENLWPVDELQLGTSHTYSQDELNVIFDTDNSEGNGLVIFAQHLSAAKLNVANGAGNEQIELVIQAADELIGDYEIPGSSFTDEEKQESGDIKDALEAYNESSPCSEEE